MGIIIDDSDRDEGLGFSAQIIGISSTGVAASTGIVYVGDVVLEVNGKLMMYKKSAEVCGEIAFTPGAVRLKLASSADLRACLLDEDRVDDMDNGDIDANFSAAADIMACLEEFAVDEDDDSDSDCVSNDVAGGDITTDHGGLGHLDDATIETSHVTETIAAQEGAVAHERLIKNLSVDHKETKTDEESTYVDSKCSDLNKSTMESEGDAFFDENMDGMLLDLALTPKTVVDQLQAKDEELTKMRLEMERLKQLRSKDEDHLALEASLQQHAVTEAEVKAANERKLMRETEISDRLDLLTRELQQMNTDNRAVSRVEAVNKAFRESTLTEEISKLKSILSELQTEHSHATDTKTPPAMVAEKSVTALELDTDNDQTGKGITAEVSVVTATPENLLTVVGEKAIETGVLDEKDYTKKRGISRRAYNRYSGRFASFNRS